jgi:hypothetical protein
MIAKEIILVFFEADWLVPTKLPLANLNKKFVVAKILGFELTIVLRPEYVLT